MKGTSFRRGYLFTGFYVNVFTCVCVCVCVRACVRGWVCVCACLRMISRARKRRRACACVTSTLTRTTAVPWEEARSKAGEWLAWLVGQLRHLFQKEEKISPKLVADYNKDVSVCKLALLHFFSGNGLQSMGYMKITVTRFVLVLIVVLPTNQSNGSLFYTFIRIRVGIYSLVTVFCAHFQLEKTPDVWVIIFCKTV